MNRLIRVLLPLGVLAVLLGATATAGAQKVANPGNVNFRLTNGVMKVKDQEFGFDESQNISFNGTIDKAGAVTIPTITFPNYSISASGFNLTIKINVVGPTTGSVNPLTGAVSLRLRVWIKIDGVPFGGDCRIASASSPIDVNALITGTSGSRTGTPYNPANGTMRIVNSTFSVPASSSCGVAAGTVDSTVGLPSAAGNNAAEFNLRTTPTLNRAINPALTASPASGTAPFTTTLDASGSTVTAGPATYRWDFTNDGTIDQTTSTPTVTHTYTTGGTQTARVQVVDAEGDVADATRQLTVAAYPDIELGVTHAGDFRVGDTGRYAISLKNVGYAATTGPVTVSSTLPAGLTYDSATGAGWGCSAAGQDLTCSRSVAIGVGATAPELGLNLKVGAEARGQVEPVFTANAAGDDEPGNDSASDPTTVRATDLRIDLTHAAHAMLPGEDPANVIEISAENVGDASTSGPTVITDELPAGLTPLTATGDGWDCEIEGQLVTCTHAGQIDPGESTEPILITVSATLEPGSLGVTVQNEAAVATADDVDPANDTATDPVLILDGQDVGVTKSHEGNLTAGQQAQYRLEARNFGTAPTTGPTVITDELPAGLTYVGADGGPDWICGHDEGIVTCSHDAPIPAGTSAPAIDLTVAVGVEAIPAVANTVEVATDDDPNPANDVATDEAIVQAIDLLIEKTHEGPLRVGERAEYTLSVRNAGDSPTVGVTTVTDPLPAGLSFVSADGGEGWACSETGGTVTCEHEGILGPDAAAEDIVLTVEVEAAAAPAVENTATVETQDDFKPSNDSVADSGVVIDADTSVGISRTGTFRPGQTGTYLIVVRNEGAVATAHPAVAKVDLPAGLELDSVAGTGWTCGELDRTVTCERAAALGAKATAPAISLRVDVTVAAIPQVETVATVTTEGDRYPDNDSDSDVTTVIGPDLAVASGHDGPFRVGASHRYLIEVANVGTGPTVGPITVTDTLPAGLEPTAAFGAGWSCSTAAPVVTCTRSAALDPDRSAGEIRVDVTPRPAALAANETEGTVENRVAVATDFDGNPENDEATDPTDLVAIDLGLEIDGPAATSIGEIAEYAARVTNLGSAATDGQIRVTDTVPAGFTPRPSGGDGWICSSAGAKVTCSYNRQTAPGEALPDLTIRARAGGAAGTVTNRAEVSTEGDVIAANDDAELETEVSAAPDLEVELQARPQVGDKLRVGTDGGYTVHVRNRGTAPTDGNVTVRVDLPAGVTFLSLDHGQGWTCQPAGDRTVECGFAGRIGPDEIAGFGFLVDITPRAADAISAEASVSSDTDLNPDNDHSVAVNAVTRIDLALTRQHQAGWAQGGTGSYELEVANVGTAATTGPAVITETLPVHTSWGSAAGEGWSCTVSGRRLRCANPESIPPGGSSRLSVTLQVGEAASPLIEATSTVTTLDDADPANDEATEAITVAAAPQKVQRKVRILPGRTATTRSGVVTVWLTCPADAGVKCRGALRLQTRGKVRVSKRKRARLNLGRARYAVAPGYRSPVRIGLKRPGRRALKLNRRMRAQATASNQGQSPTRAAVVIRRGR